MGQRVYDGFRGWLYHMLVLVTVLVDHRDSLTVHAVVGHFEGGLREESQHHRSVDGIVAPYADRLMPVMCFRDDMICMPYKGAC